eukprot:TRINITY_DN15598_c0_g1_i1.p1 TRINITY_DN15598_c0_g1~~TRINITY_DN15598_c0_g1_i1.p1  ORF type:complete len:167 (-),score=21.53 TRINITY_DN15598_c0_g1_i1:39-539(-)
MNLQTLNKNLNHKTFSEALSKTFFEENKVEYSPNKIFEIDQSDYMKIDFVRDKYFSLKNTVWDDTPPFRQSIKINLSWGSFIVELEVKKGVFTEITISSEDLPSLEFKHVLEESLLGKLYHRKGITTATKEALVLIEGSPRVMEFHIREFMDNLFFFFFFFFFFFV